MVKPRPSFGAVVAFLRRVRDERVAASWAIITAAFHGLRETALPERRGGGVQAHFAAALRGPDGDAIH